MIIKRFQYRLFIIYFMIILFVLISLSSISYYYISSNLREISMQSLRQQMMNITSETEVIIRDMDRIAVYIATNGDIKDLIDKRNDGVQIAANEMKIENIISDYLSPWFTIRQVNLYNQESFLSIGVNDYSRYAESYRNSVDMMKTITQLNGGKFLREAQIFNWSFGNEALFSLSRSFKTTKSVMIIEVQQQLKKIENIVSDANPDKKFDVFIITDDDRLIYPIEVENADFNFYKEIKIANGGGPFRIHNPNTNENEIVFMEQSSYMGLRVIVTATERILFSSVRNLTISLIVIFVLILIITFLVSLRVAKVITVPIDKMKSLANNLNIGNLTTNISDNDTEMDELKQLFNTFNNMQNRLDESIKKLISAKEQENKANLMAFQSQINPHFLYNTLTVIGAQGYENGLPVIDEMCNDLSYMLRYLTNDHSTTVTMGLEMEYAIHYLNLLKKRYEERLEYHINIPQEMNNIKVPKLIIQPVIENCILHGFRGKSIKISIDGFIDEDKWIIKVSDNGKGISQADLRLIREKIGFVIDGIDLSEITANKVGLMNTFIRLKLFNRNDYIFDIQSDCNGTTITLGGKLDV